MVKRNHSALGIDLADRSAQFCVMTAEAGVAAEGKIELTPRKLGELWRAHGDVDVVVLEAGSPATWVTELLEGLGARVIVADPRKLKAVTESVRKSDVRDAQMLARLGLADEQLLSPTYVRPPEHRRAMTQLRVRDQVVRQRSSTIAEIRATVKLEGLRLRRCEAELVHEQEAGLPEELAMVLAPLFATLRAQDAAVAAYDAQIAETSKRFPAAALLDEIDGVGPITALAFVVVVGDPARFRHTRDIGAYLGLVPRRDQSGQSDPSRRITKAGCGFLRRLLVQCAQVLCRPVGKDSALRRRTAAMLERRGKAGKRQVVVAVARRLSVVMLSMLKSQQRWQPLHRVAPIPGVDAPQTGVHDECAAPFDPSEVARQTAPSSSYRTQACTGGPTPTKSADGSTGRRGVSAPRDRTTSGARERRGEPDAIRGTGTELTSAARRGPASPRKKATARAGRPAPPPSAASLAEGSDAGTGGDMLQQSS